MMTLLTGGCLCGAIRYEAVADPIASGVCHCRDCQYVSGGAPAHAIVLPRESVTVTKGSPRTYWSVAETGTQVARSFCVECGTPLFAENARHLEVFVIKVGSLDDPSGFRPGAHIWVSSAQPWNYVDPNLPRFEKNPF